MTQHEAESIGTALEQLTARVDRIICRQDRSENRFRFLPGGDWIFEGKIIPYVLAWIFLMDAILALNIWYAF